MSSSAANQKKELEQSMSSTSEALSSCNIAKQTLFEYTIKDPSSIWSRITVNGQGITCYWRDSSTALVRLFQPIDPNSEAEPYTNIHSSHPKHHTLHADPDELGKANHQHFWFEEEEDVTCAVLRTFLFQSNDLSAEWNSNLAASMEPESNLFDFRSLTNPVKKGKLNVSDYLRHLDSDEIKTFKDKAGSERVKEFPIITLGTFFYNDPKMIAAFDAQKKPVTWIPETEINVCMVAFEAHLKSLALVRAKDIVNALLGKEFLNKYISTERPDLWDAKDISTVDQAITLKFHLENPSEKSWFQDKLMAIKDFVDFPVIDEKIRVRINKIESMLDSLRLASLTASADTITIITAVTTDITKAATVTTSTAIAANANSNTAATSKAESSPILALSSNATHAATATLPQNPAAHHPNHAHHSSNTGAIAVLPTVVATKK